MAFLDATKEVQCPECSHVALPFRNGLVRPHRNTDVSPARSACGGIGKLGREPEKTSDQRRSEVARAVLASAPRGSPHSSLEPRPRPMAVPIPKGPDADKRQEPHKEARIRATDLLSKTEKASIQKRAARQLKRAEEIEKRIGALVDRRNALLDAAARLKELLS